MTEVVKIDRVGKFGPSINGKWYGLKKPLQPTDFIAGQAYEIETEPWSKNGKSGINIMKATPASSAAPSVSVGTAKAVEAMVDQGAKKEDKTEYWAAKNDSQKLGGLFHDAAQITAAIVTANGLSTDKALEEFKKVLSAVVEIREKIG
jgi:hypothetical protein